MLLLLVVVAAAVAVAVDVAASVVVATVYLYGCCLNNTYFNATLCHSQNPLVLAQVSRCNVLLL